MSSLLYMVVLDYTKSEIELLPDEHIVNVIPSLGRDYLDVWIEGTHQTKMIRLAMSHPTPAKNVPDWWLEYSEE